MGLETWTTILSFLFMLGLIVVPFMLFSAVKRWYPLKFHFLAYLLLGLVLTAGIFWTFAWWTDYAAQLLMSHYGYDFDAMNEAGRYANVPSENQEKVQQIEKGYFGLGWPLKAMMAFVYYSPYLLIVYGIGQLRISLKRKKQASK